MNGILFIIDGLGDRPVEALGGLTPLEAARTPVMDRLAAHGRYGLVDPIDPGVIPNTHSGAGLLLGLAPQQSDRLRRGPVEAAGLGLQLQAGDIALRANFATLAETGQGMIVTDRRAGRIEEGTTELAASLGDCDLGDGVRASLTPTEQHRGLLVLSGPGLDENVSDTDPGDLPMPLPLRTCVASRKSAEFTAAKIEQFTALAFEQLRDHPVNRAREAAGELPANGVITRGAGAHLEVDNTLHLRGLAAGVVSGCNTVCGLGGLFDFEVVNDQRFTGDLDTDLESKIATAVRLVERCDVVFVHIKAPDICAHDCRPLDKRDFLERIDHVMHPLLESPLVIGVAADHTTDSNTGFHTADPVPALICLPGRFDGRENVEFGERQCAEGSLGRLVAHDFLSKFIESLKG